MLRVVANVILCATASTQLLRRPQSADVLMSVASTAVEDTVFGRPKPLMYTPMGPEMSEPLLTSGGSDSPGQSDTGVGCVCVCICVCVHDGETKV